MNKLCYGVNMGVFYVRYDMFETVLVDIFTSLLDDVGVIYRDNHLSAGFCTEHRQNSCSTANIKHNLVLE